MPTGAGSLPTFDELIQLLVGGNDPATGYSGVFREKVDAGVDEDLADAVLSAQYRGLSKQHRESLRMQLVEMTGQLDELR